MTPSVKETRRMRKILIFTALGLVVALPAVASQAPSPAPSRQVTVAVVRDGPTPARDMVALVERELKELLPGVEVRFLASPDFGAGWQADRAESALQAALTDPEVDLVLADGAMITARASAGELPKPVVSAYLQRADLFGLYDAEHDRSSKENLAWLLISGRDESDFEAFRGLVPFETAALLLPRAYLDSGEPMASALAAAAARLGFRAVGVGDDTSAAIAELDAAQAVVLSPLPQLSEDARKGLIGTLTDRGIPTFSLVGGDPDVELGALATTAGDVSRQVARRVALNLGELIRGRSVSHLPVALAVDTQLRINARTAVAVGYEPDARARILAHFVHPEALQSEEDPLTLSETLEMALAGNVTHATPYSASPAPPVRSAVADPATTGRKASAACASSKPTRLAPSTTVVMCSEPSRATLRPASATSSNIALRSRAWSRACCWLRTSPINCSARYAPGTTTRKRTLSWSRTSSSS